MATFFFCFFGNMPHFDFFSVRIKFSCCLYLLFRNLWCVCVCLNWSMTTIKFTNKASSCIVVLRLKLRVWGGLMLNPKKNKVPIFLAWVFKRFVLKAIFGNCLASSVLNANSENIHNFPPNSLSLHSCWRAVAKAGRILLRTQ